MSRYYLEVELDESTQKALDVALPLSRQLVWEERCVGMLQAALADREASDDGRMRISDTDVRTVCRGLRTVATHVAQGVWCERDRIGREIRWKTASKLRDLADVITHADVEAWECHHEECDPVEPGLYVCVYCGLARDALVEDAREDR